MKIIMFSKKIEPEFWRQLSQYKTNDPNNPFAFYQMFFNIRNNRTSRLQFFNKKGVQALWRLFSTAGVMKHYLEIVRNYYGEEHYLKFEKEVYRINMKTDFNILLSDYVPTNLLDRKEI